jgi:hypothetical protein
MRERTAPRKQRSIEMQKASSAVWNVALWALGTGGFATAMVQSLRAIHETPRIDLRTPGVLLLDAFLAAAVGLGYAVRDGVQAGRTRFVFCLRYGLWAAAVFRLLPPSINESCLFDTNSMTFDVPYVVLGAFIHGGLAAVLAWPCAVPVLQPNGRLGSAEDQGLWELCGATILTFYIVAGVVRLLAAAT